MCTGALYTHIYIHINDATNDALDLCELTRCCTAAGVDAALKALIWKATVVQVVHDNSCPAIPVIMSGSCTGLNLNIQAPHL